MSKNQDYDKILRENIEAVIPAILDKVCGLRPEKLTDVLVNLPRTRERRPDFVKKAEGGEQEANYLIHLEFQTGNDKRMEYRMLDYCTLLICQYELPVKQFVVFVGKGKPNMKTGIEYADLKFNYALINLVDIDYETFIHSDEPEEIILAVLSNFKGRDSVLVIQEILENLHQHVKNSRTLRKHLIQLEILSNLRDLQPQTVKQIEAMPLTYDITTDVRYQQGIEQGIEQGISAATRQMVARLLEKGVLALKDVAEVANVSIDYVIKVQNELTDSEGKR